MSATALRNLMHASGLVVVLLLFVLLPFSTLVNGLIASAFWIVDGIAAEAVFRSRASQDEKRRDLHDRTDYPPS